MGRARKFTPSTRYTAARNALAVCAPPFPVGAKVEVKMDSDDFAGSWFGAIVTDHAFEHGRVVRYKIEYTTLVKEDNDNSNSPETEEVSIDNVRPEAPPRLKITTGQEKFEIYKVGDKVEVVNIIKNYGVSWFPAKIEKVIGGNNYFIIYENLNNPPNGNIYEIVYITALRPMLVRNHKIDKEIELNSHVEFFHGGWTNGVVTHVLSKGNYVIKFGEGDGVLPEHVKGEFLRERFDWDGKKWYKFYIPRKRGRRQAGSVKSANKKQKNDISPSKKKSGNKDKLKCRKGKLTNEIDSSTLFNMKTGMRSSDGDNNSNSPSNPNELVLVVNPNPNEGILSREINADITLPFDKMSPLWKPLEELDYFKKIPQTPHFNSLKRCCEEERDGKALGLVAIFARLTKSIPNLSPDADLALIEQKLTMLKSLEQDGFKVDPLRTRLNSLIETKKEISQRDLIKAEKETELAQRLEDYNYVWHNIVKLDAELAKVRDKERRLKDKKESFLERSVVNGEWINNLEREIKELERENELAREKWLLPLPLE